ncbi:hypothetical protein Tco_0584133 [Tanacetum coccineum]
MVTSIGIRHAKTHTLRGKVFDETRVEVIRSLAIQYSSLNSLIPIEAWSCPHLHNQWRHPWDPLQLVSTPENMPLAYRASTSANPDPMMSPAFIEANYEVLESLLRERRKQICNEDLRTELEYFSEGLRGFEDRERVVEFEDAPNRDRSRVERNSESGRPSEQRAEDGRIQGMNLPPLLAAHLGRNGNGGISILTIEAKEVATNGAPNDHRESFDRFKKSSSWDNNKGKKNRDMFSPYRGSNHGLLSNLSKSPMEILATEKVAKTFKQPPRMVGSKRSRDMSKYCHFHEDHGHDTNQFRELRHQIEEAVKSGQLAHLVKGIKIEHQPKPLSS